MKLQFLFSTHCLILVYFCSHFRESIFDGFLSCRVDTVFIGKFSKGHNSLKNVDGVTILFVYTSFDGGGGLYLYKVS